ncbi:MAG: hypothetical protein ACRDBG_24820, partial [Waterburya sp.]
GYEMKQIEDIPVTSRELPQRDIVDYTEASRYIDTIPDLNLQQLLRAKMEDELSLLTQRQLPQSRAKEYTIAKVRATELGYSVKEIGTGSALGKFIANNVAIGYEQRVGKYTVKHYEVNDTLDTAIKTYFSMKRMLA